MISKKIRFEVFKRDGFQCAYCGKTPPEVMLEVDHIDPVSGGGTDDINNLLTACFDCNRGKKNIKLDKIPTKLNENLEILKEKEEQLKEYNKIVKKIEKRFNKQVEELEDILDQYFPEHPDYQYRFDYFFRKNSLKRFIELLPFEEVKQSLNLAMNKMFNDFEKKFGLEFDSVEFRNYRDQAIKYFCGICWNKIKIRKPITINNHEPEINISENNEDGEDEEDEEDDSTLNPIRTKHQCVYCSVIELEGFSYNFQGRYFWVCNNCKSFFQKHGYLCAFCKKPLKHDGIYYYLGGNMFVCSEECMKECIEKGYLV